MLDDLSSYGMNLQIREKLMLEAMLAVVGDTPGHSSQVSSVEGDKFLKTLKSMKN